MEFEEKAKIRMEHWIRHGRSHLEEYRGFSRDLEAAGKSASAQAVSQMAEYTQKGLASLENALAVLSS